MKKLMCIFSLLLTSTGFAQGQDFFNQADDFFKKYVATDGVRYQELSNSRSVMQSLTNYIGQTDVSGWDKESQMAYYINAYNLLVIDKLRLNYPTKSPMDIPGFFDNNTAMVNGQQMSLNTLEKKVLFNIELDPRFHFVLVCGAKGCPSIANFAYKPATLEEQLQAQTVLALNSNDFVKYSAANKTLGLSKIFDWYADDFGGKKATIAYINGYRTNPILDQAKISYYDYDWSINESFEPLAPVPPTTPTPPSGTGPGSISKSEGTKTGSISSKKSELQKSEPVKDAKDSDKKIAPIVPKKPEEPARKKSNVQTFTPSVLLKKGQGDITLFNSIYTQKKSKWMGEVFEGDRETFYTSLLQFTYGVSENARLNAGIDINLKSSGVSRGDDAFSNIDRAFAFTNSDSTRAGLSSIALRVKYALSTRRHLSVESSFSFPTAKSPEGTSALYFLDWDRYIWWNRFYFDKTFANKFQLFAEADLLFRIKRYKTQNSALDTPVSAFLSYFVNAKTTVYTMAQHVWRFRHSSATEGFSDAITTPANYTTYGFGGKYQLTRKLNLELLFTNFFRSKNAGLGSTYNVGLKYLFN